MSIRKDINELEYLTEHIVRYEREKGLGMGEAFDQYEEALQWIYSANNNSPNFRNDHSEHQDVFELIVRTGIHRKDDENYLWKLEKRLQEYKRQFQDNDELVFDDMELIVRYRVEADELGKVPSARDARDSNHMPTQTAFLSDDEDEGMQEWSDVKWRAGFEGHQKYGTELLLEKLYASIHRYNEGRSIDEYEFPKGKDLSDIEGAPTARTLRNDEDLGCYKQALEILGFQRIRKDTEEADGKWQAIDETVDAAKDQISG